MRLRPKIGASKNLPESFLYGPQGSGKIFWARKIAEIINYEFKEVMNSYLRTSLSTEKEVISMIF